MPDLASRGLVMARDAAIDRNCNLCNLEHHWCTFWTLVAHCFASRIHLEYCYVTPQWKMQYLLIKGEDPNKIVHLKPDSEERDSWGDGIEVDEGKNVGEERR